MTVQFAAVRPFLRCLRLQMVDVTKLSTRIQQLDTSQCHAAKRLAYHLKVELNLASKRNRLFTKKNPEMDKGKGKDKSKGKQWLSKGKGKGKDKSSLLRRLATATVHSCPPPEASRS